MPKSEINYEERGLKVSSPIFNPHLSGPPMIGVVHASMRCLGARLVKLRVHLQRKLNRDFLHLKYRPRCWQAPQLNSKAMRGVRLSSWMRLDFLLEWILREGAPQPLTARMKAKYEPVCSSKKPMHLIRCDPLACLSCRVERFDITCRPLAGGHTHSDPCKPSTSTLPNRPLSAVLLRGQPL
jgi:hypothetical protein